jgi:hypothetical protein
VQQGRIGTIDLDSAHSARHDITNDSSAPRRALVTLLAPDPQPAAERLEADLLIREARRRQRRRRLVLVVSFVAVLGSYLIASTSAPPRPSASLLSRPLHFPSLGPSGACPVSSGSTFDNSVFGGVALGAGPVRVLLADRGNILRGRVDLGASETPGWSALQTLWFAMPRYDGPFVVRAARLGAHGPIEVQPDQTGLRPGSGPLVVAAGATANTQDAYRTVPGSTWVRSPGCYAWQIDGPGFSEIVVADAVAPAK